MIIKGIVSEDFINYKLPSFVIEFPYCSFKCDKEAGCNVCQNSSLANAQNFNIGADILIEKYYLSNHITNAVVMQGLEPIDSIGDLVDFIGLLRSKYKCNDDVVIYTGYDKYEISSEIHILKQFKNIIIKYGRYIPNKEAHYDDVLGVNLASPNQYAERIS